jgi:putative toxin-antitoxin system antitoxin component (TIGR02293 family)
MFDGKWHRTMPRKSQEAPKRRPAAGKEARPPGFSEEESLSAYSSGLGADPDSPSFRLAPDALERLERHGYSESEIFALVVPKRTLARRRAAGSTLSAEETDKALRLERIAAQAERVFGDNDKACRWLRKPKRQLMGATPLAFLASEAGARKVEEMLHRIDYGIAA